MPAVWAAVPKIKIEVERVYTCGSSQTCVAQIKVVVDVLRGELSLNPAASLHSVRGPRPPRRRPPAPSQWQENTTLNVCDVIEYDASGLVVSLNAYKSDDLL